MDEKNFFEEFIKNFGKEMKNMGHANLIIAGKTGVGKSTLINAAFRENLAETGIGAPVTDEGSVRCYEKQNFPLRIYDTIGLELNEERRKKSLELIKSTCNECKKENNADKFIHAMWYCVASDSDRLEPFEAEYINTVAEEIDVILVITKSYRKKHSKNFIDAIMKDYPGLKIKNSVVVLAQDETLEDCDSDEIPRKSFGVDTLVEITAQIMPEAAQKAWCNAQKASIKLKCDKAHTLVLTTAAVSFGEGYMPLPFSDSMALIPTQITMLAGITAIFGITVSQNLLKSIVTSLAGTAGATFVGKAIAANLLKLIPGVGTALGGTISGATAAALTTALGEAYIAVMKMIVNGEINEQDLGTKEVQNKLQEIYKEKAKKKV